MCGICGFLNFKGDAPAALLARMAASLAHRGPDGEGAALPAPGAGLGHRRLSIIDLDGGAQPMASADGRFLTVFNGEIYNYLELRGELARLGSVFRTRSDTEVIAEAIRHWGLPAAARRMRGMFAFAVHDGATGRLHMARDPVGIKPLLVAEAGGALFFASEAKALLHAPGLSAEPDPEAIHDFLTLGFPVTPATCWKAIRSFPPGHVAEAAPGEPLRPVRFWDWTPRPEPMPFEDALAAAREALRESLRLHLRADVPLGAFLSGGIDSSLVVRLLSDGLSDGLRTFTVAFDEPRYDESAAAAEVAALCRTAHHVVRAGAGAGDPELFEAILTQYDDPFGDSSCLPTYMVCREMRRHIKVVLSGDGGDELFGGYDRFRDIETLAAMRRLPAKSALAALAAAAAPLLGPDASRRLAKALAMASGPEASLPCAMHTYFSERERRSGAYAPAFRALAAGIAPTWERAARFLPPPGSGRLADRLAAFELALNVHADYLRKVDTASSAHGLEVRTPFLDVGVMAFAARLPFSHKIGGGECKRLLRELARRSISPAIGSKAKQGFGIPFDAWCGPRMADYLDGLLFRAPDGRGVWSVLDKRAAEPLRAQFLARGGDAASRSRLSRFQAYQRVFLMAAMQIWMRRHSISF